MSYDLGEDLPEDAGELLGLMRTSVQDINVALSQAVDRGTGLELAEDRLQNGFELYQDMMDFFGLALSYGNYQEHVRKNDVEEEGVPREIGVESKQVLEYVPLLEAAKTYEEAVLRYIGVRDGVEIGEFESLQALLQEQDVDLPRGLDREVFYEDAELVDYTGAELID